MIYYHARCGQGHEFDGWFKDSATFDKLISLGLLQCPECGDQNVSRALMAPAVVGGRSSPPPASPQPPSPPAPAAVPAAPPQAVAGALPDQMRGMLQRLRAEVEKHCDYVGERFADEARRIHRGESDKRGIYGETSPTEAEALADEGIQVSRIPWVPRADG